MMMAEIVAEYTRDNGREGEAEFVIGGREVPRVK